MFKNRYILSFLLLCITAATFFLTNKLKTAVKTTNTEIDSKIELRKLPNSKLILNLISKPDTPVTQDNIVNNRDYLRPIDQVSRQDQLNLLIAKANIQSLTEKEKVLLQVLIEESSKKSMREAQIKMDTIRRKYNL